MFYGDKCASGAFGLVSSKTSGVAEFTCDVALHTVGLEI